MARFPAPNPDNKCGLHNVVGRPCDQKIPVAEIKKLSHLKDGQAVRVNGKTVTGNAQVRGMAGYALRARSFHHGKHR